MKLRFPIFALALLLAAAPAYARQLEADAQILQTCIDDAVPEGEAPPGPARERQAKAVADGPFACIGKVASACGSARGAECNRRESLAWLSLVDPKNAPRRAGAAYRAGAGEIRARAVALCRSAASVSAWGGEQVKKGAYKPGLDNLCVREAIGAMSVIVPSHMRGA